MGLGYKGRAGAAMGHGAENKVIRPCLHIEEREPRRFLLSEGQKPDMSCSSKI